MSYLRARAVLTCTGLWGCCGANIPGIWSSNGAAPNFNMANLHNPGLYTTWELECIQGMSSYAVELANRWAIGWPERVRALVGTGEYMHLLIRQEYMERDALCWAHANQRKVEDVFLSRGLSMAPPLALPERPLSDQPGTAGRLTVQLDTLDEQGKPEEMTFFGLSESAYVEMLPHAMEPKPDALYRGSYRYDVGGQKWVPIDDYQVNGDSLGA